jgi:hypothetical protein
MADTRLRVAAEAALELGTRGNDPAVIRLKDKASVVDLVPSFGPPSLGFERAAVPVAEIENIRKQSPQGQVILKPVCGAGALGTFVAASTEDVAGIAARIERMHLPAHLADKWLAQAFIAGELISLEGFVTRAGIRFLGFTSRRKVASTESAARFPIDRALPESLKLKARSAVTELIGKSGFSRGYFHVEFISSGGDCWLIDANMGRVGGGAIAEQLAISFGSTPLAVFRHILEVTLTGTASSDPYAGEPIESYAIFYGVDRMSHILDVSLPESSGCLHTRILGEGAVAPPMGENDWAWVGILSGQTSAVEQTIRDMRIQTESGPVAPVF